jgi:DNA polymerase-3 subunit delta'
MLFSHVVGHAEIKARLIGNMREGRIAHAQLFLGPRGSGALPMALAYAQYLLCEKPDVADSCGTCPDCVQAAKLEHPDLHLAFPIVLGDKNKNKRINTCGYHVAAWRSLVLQDPYLDLDRWRMEQDKEEGNKQPLISVDIAQEIQNALGLKAYRGGWKVLVIWLAERMNSDAANKLLKLLEEPEPGTVILMVAQQADLMLPTILSRVQQVRIPALRPGDIATVLREKMPELSPDDAALIALRAEGDLLEALDIASSGEEELFVFFRDWLRDCYGAKVSRVAQCAEQFQKMGREQQKALLRYGLYAIRQCVFTWQKADELVRAIGQEEEFARRFGALLTDANAEGLRQELENAHLHLERNANPKILFMDLSYSMMRLLRKGR